MERPWFGREPALWIQTIGQLLALVVGFGLPGLNDTLAVAIMGVVTALFGVWTAWMVRPMAPTIWTSLIVAGAALGVELGFSLSQQQIAALTAFAVAVMTLILRSQVTPAHDPQSGIVVASAPPARHGLGGGDGSHTTF